MEGPFGTLNYTGFGTFLLKKKPIRKSKIGLVAAGTGITPIFQII